MCPALLTDAASSMDGLQTAKYNPRTMVLDFFVSAPYWPIGCPAGTSGRGIFAQSTARITGWPGTEMLNLSRPEAVEASPKPSSSV